MTQSNLTPPPDTTNAQAATGELVFFGEDWGRHPSTAQYLARELFDDFNVTWINSIGLREPSLSRADMARVVGKVKRALGQTQPPTDEPAPVEETSDPNHLLSPWIVPLHRYAMIRTANKTLFKRQFAQLAHLQNTPYAVVTANPASYYLLDTLAPTQSLYYCADKYAHIAGLNPTLVERFERELLERVDTVVATSQPLAEDLAKHHRNVHYLPHGVDFERFNSTLRHEGHENHEGEAVDPVIGFIGLLGEHIDFELIAASAAALPETKFLFVGPVEQGVSLPAAPNIEYLGAVPQEALPVQLARMSLCTLPYAMTQRNHYANPTKVREYLAAGRAVVATNQPGLVDIQGAVSIADDTDTYINALRARLAELPVDRASIAEPMRAETWAARANRLRSLLTP